MPDKRNTWSAKIKRTFTSVLPITKTRQGRCLNCGQCCKLPNRCPFFRYDSNNKAYCFIYFIRPLNCRKYPRVKSELITKNTCGYKF